VVWIDDFRQDVQRHVEFDHKPVLYEVLTKQGLWASLQYRVAAAIYRSSLPPLIKKGLLLVMAAAKKGVEITTGISIPHTARVGPGLYIPHFGTIVIHGDAVIGRNCIVSHGVTIGAAGRGARFGVPVIGDNVYVAPNAVVVGKIVVGDNAIIGANSTVNRDVAAHTTVLGVPATVLNHRGHVETDDVA
jgi:serine O-acetyltransferase